MRSRLQPNVVEAATLYGSSRRVARCALALLTPPYTPLHPLASPYIPLQVASPAAMARARSARERSTTNPALDGVLPPGLG